MTFDEFPSATYRSHRILVKCPECGMLVSLRFRKSVKCPQCGATLNPNAGSEDETTNIETEKEE
jgi:ribosomal protein S27E